MSDTNKQSQDPEIRQRNEREHRIRERAYFIWEEEGRPAGRHLEHWERARVHIEEEDGTGPWVDRGS
jgi:hypothetical protein